MSMRIIQNFTSLEKELETAKTNLKDLNENIKRIYGKQDNFSDKKRTTGSFDAGKNRNDLKVQRNFEPPFAKRRSDTFSRLGVKEDDDDDFPKPKISSRVISKEHPPVTRENALAMQSKNTDLARNKRMFGSLLGTLQKFRSEEDRGVLEKRAKIEMKIEQQQMMVKEQIKHEKDTLIADRRRKQLEIKSLELKMIKLRNLKTWEEHKQSLFKFIGTKSKPQIFYLPKVFTPKTDELLKQTQEELQKTIDQRRRDVEKEIQDIEERLENDLQALKDGKLKKSHDAESETSETNDTNNFSDNENNDAMKDVVKKDEDNSIGDGDRKRKRSISPEKTLRSQVVVKKRNH
ncbi:CLUMA_CG003218, isoform A [Clunio marinus]|uniref:CLUMA_CG003218, isoform A n=1 Tax=Clunio marinus TaxID=568069 RepID=A0A1J1HPM5_9DIPT|nr:CLUMA_CG003218, isoform A [Clunio marinus]